MRHAVHVLLYVYFIGSFYKLWDVREVFKEITNWQMESLCMNLISHIDFFFFGKFVVSRLVKLVRKKEILVI